MRTLDARRRAKRLGLTDDICRLQARGAVSAGLAYGVPTTNTISVRGPWTPSTRSSSMSEVADGPEMSVVGEAA